MRVLWILAIMMLFGCAYPEYEFIVLRDVPKYPSFVVLPANDHLGQVEFANQIETAIIGCNVKVVNRPAKKDVTKTVEKGVLGLEAENNRVIQGDAGYQLIESYPSYHDFNADYIVITYATYKRVRIIKRGTEEVLASIDLKNYMRSEMKSRHYRQSIAVALFKLGISKMPLSLNVP